MKLSASNRVLTAFLAGLRLRGHRRQPVPSEGRHVAAHDGGDHVGPGHVHHLHVVEAEVVERQPLAKEEMAAGADPRRDPLALQVRRGRHARVRVGRDEHFARRAGEVGDDAGLEAAHGGEQRGALGRGAEIGAFGQHRVEREAARGELRDIHVKTVRRPQVRGVGDVDHRPAMALALGHRNARCRGRPSSQQRQRKARRTTCREAPHETSAREHF